MHTTTTDFSFYFILFKNYLEWKSIKRKIHELKSGKQQQQQPIATIIRTLQRYLY